jgi:hypothetical protein
VKVGKVVGCEEVTPLLASAPLTSKLHYVSPVRLPLWQDLLADGTYSAFQNRP